jgi:hypothetical protein
MVGGGRSPAGRLLFPGIAGDHFGIGPVGFGPAQFTLGERLDLGGVHHTDPAALSSQKLGQRRAVGPGRFEGDQRRFRAKSGEPGRERDEPGGGIGKDLVAILGVLKAGDIKLLLGDIDAHGNLDHGSKSR